MAMKLEQKRLASLPGQWVTVNGCRMHYRAAGRGQQAIVMVHGLTVSGNYLLPAAVELLDDFAVYVPDLPGFAFRHSCSRPDSQKKRLGDPDRDFQVIVR